MILLYFICSLSFSLSKYVCFDDTDSKMCNYINELNQNKYVKYSFNELNDLFNESFDSLYLAIFQSLGPISIPNNILFDEFSVISNFLTIELSTKSEYLTFKKFDVCNATIKITTNSNTINLLNITDTFIRSNSHFLPSNNQNTLKLIMNKCDSFQLLQDFDEFEIDLPQINTEKVSYFTLPSITNDCFFNHSIKISISDTNLIKDDFSLILYTGKGEDSLAINSKSYIFSKSSNFLKINTSLPLTYIHNCSDILDIYVLNDYCLYSNFQSINGLSLKFYSGIARFHGDCNEKIDLNRSTSSSFLINSIFYNDSSIEFDINSPSSSLPLSIIASNNLKIKLNQQFTSIQGYLFLENGNITIKTSNQNNEFTFVCSSFLNFSEKVYNDRNIKFLSFVDLTESEFYESITHLELTNYVLLDENVTFSPKFLINALNIIGGTTVSNLINEDCSGIGFKPQTKLTLKENGTVVIPYHLNFNETYEGVMKVHNERYNQLVEKGENRTFDFNDFGNSFKYYYVKYMPVFNNFTEVFIKTFNQFYPPVIENDQKSLNSESIFSLVDHHDDNLKHYIRLFVKRDDSPINSWYDTRYRPLICNFSIKKNDKKILNENYEIEFSNSLVSEFAKVGEFKLNGEIKFNETTSCIDYRVKKPPTSSSELFVFLINNDLIDSAKHIPFLTIITPTSINDFYNLMRNNESKNVIIVVCEDMTDKVDFTKLRADANIFVIGFSIKYMNEMIDFFNTIRNGNNLKKDLKKALDKISPKIPEILPIARLKILKTQSLTAIGVTIDNSLIECGSITLALCTFSGRTFMGSTNLVTDLYSLQNLLEKIISYKFINVSLVPNFIGNKGGTTDLLSVTKIEFDENNWFFYSKGTIYDNATMVEQQENLPDKNQLKLLNSQSYNFGIPYIIAEKEFFIYSITDDIEFSLIQSKIPPKALHFISGEKVSKRFLKEKISILSDSESDNLVEIPEKTTLYFTGEWDLNEDSVGQFTFEFGNSNAIIEKVPSSLDILFSGGKNMTIDCNNRNHKIESLSGNGPISIKLIDGDVSIDSLSIKPFDDTFLNINGQSEFLHISKIECEQHSKAKLDKILLKKIILNPDSSLEITNLNLDEKASIKFNYNYDYEMPFLVINNSQNDDFISKINSIVLNFSRNHHSKYNPSFENNLNKSRTFLKIVNSKCSLFDDKLFSFESDFLDFNSQKLLHLQCIEIGNEAEFTIKLLDRPSLALSNAGKNNDADQIKEDPLNPPYLYIPTPSPTPKQNDMSVAIIGGSIGGVAFAGIIAFVIYFIISGKKEDEALLDSMERRNARNEGQGLDESVDNTIGASVENGINESIESTTNESIENANDEEKKSDANGESLTLNEEDQKFKDDFEKP